MRRRILVAVVALAAAMAGAWWLFVTFSPEVHLDIAESELQSRLSARFPLKNCSLLLLCFELSEPKLSLANGSDRVHFSSQLSATVAQRSLTGSIAFSGKVRYVRYEGQFFLDEVQIETLSMQGFPADFTELVRVRGPAIMRLALQHHPVYTIKGNTAHEALAKLAVRDVRVVDGKLRVTFLKPGA